jgi:hypothetical protein
VETVWELDQEELAARDIFWLVWDRHFVPVGDIGGKLWPAPVPGSGPLPDHRGFYPFFWSRTTRLPPVTKS